MHRRSTLLALLALPLSAQSQLSFDYLREVIRQFRTERKIPSVAVAVAYNGKIVFQEGFGYADKEGKIEATAHTSYSLASVSKPMTATALMILKHRRLIDLDRPVTDYLDRRTRFRCYLPGAPVPTVRQLAKHTGGLGWHYQFFFADEPYRRPSFEEMMRRYGTIYTPPGERYYYSNFGYAVLPDPSAWQVGQSPPRPTLDARQLDGVLIALISNRWRSLLVPVPSGQSNAGRLRSVKERCFGSTRSGEPPAGRHSLRGAQECSLPGARRQ